MKKILAGLIVLGLVAAAFPVGLVAAPEKIILKNTTGYPLQRVYIAPASWGDWGEDLLGGQNLEDEGETILGLTAIEEGDCSYDIRAIDMDGDEYVRYDINLCEQAEIVLSFDDYVENEGDGGDAGLYDEGYNAGYEEGIKAGRQEGFKEGYGQGFKDGFKEGSGKSR